MLLNPVSTALDYVWTPQVYQRSTRTVVSVFNCEQKPFWNIAAPSVQSDTTLVKFVRLEPNGRTLWPLCANPLIALLKHLTVIIPLEEADEGFCQIAPHVAKRVLFHFVPVLGTLDYGGHDVVDVNIELLEFPPNVEINFGLTLCSIQLAQQCVPSVKLICLAFVWLTLCSTGLPWQYAPFICFNNVIHLSDNVLKSHIAWHLPKLVFLSSRVSIR